MKTSKKNATRVIIQVVASLPNPDTVLKRIANLSTRSANKAVKTVVVISQLGKFAGLVKAAPSKTGPLHKDSKQPKYVTVKLHLQEKEAKKPAAPVKVKKARVPRAEKTEKAAPTPAPASANPAPAPVPVTAPPVATPTPASSAPATAPATPPPAPTTKQA